MKKSIKIGIAILAIICCMVFVSGATRVSVRGILFDNFKLTKSDDIVVCSEGTESTICDVVCSGDCGEEINDEIQRRRICHGIPI